MSRKVGDKFEKKVAQKLDAKRTSNSGATFGNGDLTNDTFLIECKVKTTESLSISAREYKKAKQQADKHGKDVIFCQKTKLGEFAILSLETLRELLYLADEQIYWKKQVYDDAAYDPVEDD